MKPTSIAEMASKYTQYDMIQKYTKLPAFPEHRVSLLFHFLNSGAVRVKPFSELFSLVTALVQVGLDTHDLVDNDASQAAAGGNRQRQLSILAGDYLSSRFYQLLAKAGQIDTIRRLSEAICEVNKLKMNAYTKMKTLALSAEEYLQGTVAIRTCLFLPFTHMMEGLYRTIWPELLEHLAACEVIDEELHREEPHTEGSWAYWFLREHGTAAKAKVRPHLLDLLDVHREQLMNKLSLFHAEEWFEDLYGIDKPMRWTMGYNKLVEKT